MVLMISQTFAVKGGNGGWGLIVRRADEKIEVLILCRKTFWLKESSPPSRYCEKEELGLNQRTRMAAIPFLRNNVN